MRRSVVSILTLSVSLALSAGVGLAQPSGEAGSVLTRPPRGSLAAQLRLKLSLQMAGGMNLAASLDHNRQEWKMLSPDQREQFRRYAFAFLRKNPDEQDKLMKGFSAFLSLTQQKREAYRQRAEWVDVVVATFTDAQREQLRKMSSMDRARALIERRDELVRQGKLTLNEPPTTAPAAPVDRP